MTLIEGIGDEVTHFFIALFTVIIVSIAWWTTNIPEPRHVRTVLLLDRRPNSRLARRFRIPRTLTNHTETVTISEGTPLPQAVPNVVSSSTETETSNSSTVNTETPSGILKTTENTEASTSTVCNRRDSSSSSSTTTNQEETEEQNNIIDTMDADQNVVRQRRLAFYTSSDGTASSSEKNNTTEQPNDLPQTSSSSLNTNSDETVVNKEQNVKEQPCDDNSSSITIKLKFINDDLKIVSGKFDEYLGDFKKKHFDTELGANKNVKFIFQGQVLKNDNLTLKACGLFDNCVVHCLIHPKRATPDDRQNTQQSSPSTGAIANEFFENNPFSRAVRNVNNNNQGIDWDLGNFLFALISFILLAAWYFRYVYAHLYTVTATVGLILITGIFTIVLVGMYFPDNEQMPHPSIRIARVERVEAH